MTASEIIEISLSRSGCFGTCPVFEFVASRHAGYSYKGVMYCEPLGVRKGGLPGYLFNRMAELCLELKILELDDEYMLEVEDLSRMTVKVHHKNGVKMIIHESYVAEPLRLWAFGKLIEVIMQEAFFIEDRNKR